MATLCLGLASGCHQDMMKATPFVTGEFARTIGSPEGRINAWPLLYHRDPATSFLWPLGEVTDTTWALRPFVAKYDQNLDVLWPLVHVRWGEHPWGYVLPLGGWGEGGGCIFPLFAWGTDASSSWLMTPLYCRRTAQDAKLHVIPPALSWWERDAEQRTSWHFLLSTLAWGEGQDGRFFRIFPLFDTETGSDGASRMHFCFALGGASRSEREDSTYFFPLFSSVRTKLRQRSGPPAAGPESRPPGQTYTTPEPCDDRDGNVLFFLYDWKCETQSSGDRYERRRVLWRLYHDESLGARRSIDVFPFFAWDRDGDDSVSWSWLWRFVRYERKGEEKALNLLFLPAIRWK